MKSIILEEAFTSKLDSAAEELNTFLLYARCGQSASASASKFRIAE